LPGLFSALAWRWASTTLPSPRSRPLWSGRTRPHHGHHIDRRLRQHDRLAAIGLVGGAFRLAWCVPGLGELASPDRPTVEPALDPASAPAREVGRGRRTTHTSATGCDAATGLRVRRNVVCDRRDGGASSASSGNRRGQCDGCNRGCRPCRSRSSRRSPYRIRGDASGAPAGLGPASWRSSGRSATGIGTDFSARRLVLHRRRRHSFSEC
jgi:hypothetical protein